MYARRSTQVRRRSAQRADESRANKALGGGRAILDIAFFDTESASTSTGLDKGKRRAKDEEGGRTTGTERADARRRRAVGRHLYTHSLDVLIPLPNLDQEVVADDDQAGLLVAVRARDQGLSEMLNGLQSDRTASISYLATVPLALFLSPEFVTGFIRNGSLIALSIPEAGSEDAVALDGQGLLTLSLTRETYQTLGLVGRESRFHRSPSGRMGDRDSGPAQRFVVELPLASAAFVPGMKGYERALACLRAWDLDRASKARVDSSYLGANDNYDTNATKMRLVPTDIGAGLSASLSNGPLFESSGTSQTTSKASWPMLFAWTPPSYASDSEGHGQEGARPTAPIVFPKSLVRAQDVRRLSTPVALHALPDAWVPSLAHPAATATSSTRSTREQVERLDRAEPTLIPTVAGRAKAGGKREIGGGRNMDDVREVAHSILSEWTGLAALRSESMRTFSRPDPLVDAGSNIPTPRWAGCVLHLSWRGFLPPAFCAHVVERVQGYLDANTEEGKGGDMGTKAATDGSNGHRGRGVSKNGPAAASDTATAADTTSISTRVAQSYLGPTDGEGARWASVTANGFEHAPLSWASSVPGQGTALGSGLPLGHLNGGKNQAGPRARTRVASSRVEASALPSDLEGEEEQGADEMDGLMRTDDEDDAIDTSHSSSEEEDAAQGDHHEQARTSANGSGVPHAINSKHKARNAKQRARLKRRRRSHVREGETEHGSGRVGWSAVLLGRGYAPMARARAQRGGLDTEDGDGAWLRVPRYVLLEDVGVDTRQ